MYNRKSKFWATMFSFLPGAGHLYLGLTKTGASYMVVFFASCILCGMPGLSLFAFVIPIIWCLSFFDCLNKSSYTLDQLRLVPDQYFFVSLLNLDDQKTSSFMAGKGPYLLGGFLIFTGIYALVRSVLFDILRSFLDYQLLNTIWNYCGTIVVALVLMAVGIILIRGRRTPPSAQENEDNLPRQ